MSKGTVEFMDTILVVTDISLRDGSFFVTAEGTGPIPEYRGPAKLVGPDGVVVYSGGHVDCPPAPPGIGYKLELSMTQPREEE